jgi:KaiC/GvpD/RAD55 family RecA-like ATPase
VSSRLAQQLYDMGFRVWPIIPETKTPAARGFGADKGEVSYHPDDFGDNDVAVLTGPCALGNLVCVDLDEGEWPEWLTRTPTLTSKGGRHRWYNDPTGRVRQKVRWLPGIDVKAGLGAYAIESKGGRLLFDNLDAPIAELPQGPTPWPTKDGRDEARGEWTPPTNKRTPSARFRDSWISRFVRDPGGSNKLAGGLGSVLADWGYDDDEIESTIRDWLKGSDAKLGKHVDDALRAAEYRREGRPAPGIPSLLELGVDIGEEKAFTPSDDPQQLATNMGGRWYRAADIEICQLEPVAWVSERWAIAPGAPVLVSGYGGTGKTMLVQALATAVATPGRTWLGEQVRHGPVVHIDHEQGSRETIDRYQRLGLKGTSDLTLCVEPSHWRLSYPKAADAIRVLGRGAALLIIDSLRASTPGAEENESSIREFLDILTPISEETGCAMLIVHHSRKGGGDDPGGLETVRGSSALVDAASTVISVTREADGTGSKIPMARLVKTRTTGEATRDLFEASPIKVARGSDGHISLFIDASAGDRIEDQVADLPEGLTFREVTAQVKGKAQLVWRAYKNRAKDQA